MQGVFLLRELPEGLSVLAELASDLRWTWSHEGDQLWRTINAEVWEKTQNPWLMLQSISRADLAKLRQDPKFNKELQELVDARQHYLSRRGWFRDSYPEGSLQTVAYFSMEFGLGEALPLYAGGLGILAGDYLKSASDLQVPIVGIGLAYQEGYFRQILDIEGWQMETYPYNDPVSLPIQAAMDANGDWVRIPLELPGRVLWLRVWRVQIGCVSLYLLDSNDPLNTPVDRGITDRLYDSQPELRLMQEMVLGIGGWRLLKSLGIPVEVCHLNEGHAAFVAVERARDFMQQTNESFQVAMCAVRAGNVFTTHTPVSAGFDRFSPDLIARYFRDYLETADISLKELLSLGRQNPGDPHELFNMAYLAVRGSARINAVSRLHAQVSRRIFAPLYSRWPEAEVPIDYITNGVHMPTWDSQAADDLWTRACGKDRWLRRMAGRAEAIQSLSDADLWALRTEERKQLVQSVREKLVFQLRQHSTRLPKVRAAEKVLDDDALTIGFARRFTAYKRPNLILTDPARFAALLNNPHRPVQLVAAGKAHPSDLEGKRLIQEFVDFARQPEVRHRVVFLEDYDIATAQQLVQGVDLWLNTPRRPWEACGTSGMKVLVNGGLNLSELDGWWAEAYSPGVGWAIGDGREHSEPGWDAVEADQLYERLEKEVVPEFYTRDEHGIPRGWTARMRASMSDLALQYSGHRMLRQYVEEVYIPTTEVFRKCYQKRGQLARKVYEWDSEIKKHWPDVRFGPLEVSADRGSYRFRVPVHLGGIDPGSVSVELYADPLDGGKPFLARMTPAGGSHYDGDSTVYEAEAPASRPSAHYTPRIIPANPDIKVPLEETRILWQK